MTATDFYLDQLRKDTQDERDKVSHESMCKHLETCFAATACKCCNELRRPACELCGHVFPRIGWHTCKHEQHMVWREGTLWEANNATMSELFLLDMKARGDGFEAR